MDQTERNIAAIQGHIEELVADLRSGLNSWIEKQNEAAEPCPAGNKFPGHYAALSIALLETALNRYFCLHGPAASRDLVTAAFDRQAEKFRRSLQ